MQPYAAYPGAQVMQTMQAMPVQVQQPTAQIWTTAPQVMTVTAQPVATATHMGYTTATAAPMQPMATMPQPMATTTGSMAPQLAAMYQQYMMRWQTMQRLAATAQGMQAYAPPGPGAEGPSSANPGMYYKTKLCNRWKDGNCPYGDSCKYAHGEAELRQAPADNMRAPAARDSGISVEVDKRQLIQLMKKTRLCQEFMTSGVCRYGDRCTFAHGEHELRQAPNFAAMGIRLNPTASTTGAGASTVQQQPLTVADRMSLRKTKLCEKFMNTGVCPYNERCSFAHGAHELRQRTDALPAPAPPRQAPQYSNPEQAQLAQQYEQYQAQQVPMQVGAKRGREDGVDLQGSEGAGPTGPPMDHAGAKRVHAEEENANPDCPMCARLCGQGRAKTLASINAMENPKAQQLGCIILAASQRLDLLWEKCSPAMVLGWLSKMQGQISTMDKIEVLKTVCFHVHNGDPSSRGSGGSLGIDSQKYVEMGLPDEVADFVYTVMEGKEATATMSEYFHMLEVCKQLFTISDDTYYTVSAVVAQVMMGMI